MKSFYIIIISVILGNLCAMQNIEAQGSSTEELIDQGVQLHRSGQYNSAVKMYQNALDINPASADAHYEIALSYIQLGKYDKAIDHCNHILESESNLHSHAYIALASSHDYKGDTEKSIEILEKAITEGYDSYLVNYNLAYNYFSLQNTEKAIRHVEDALQDNWNHASSHLLLAYIRQNREEYIHASLSLYYYLMLEPKSVRSEATFRLLINTLGKSGSMESVEENYSSVVSYLSQAESVDQIMMDSEFNYEAFYATTASVFSNLSNEPDILPSIYSDFYIPFFSTLEKSDQLSSYCRYISQIVSQENFQWAMEEREKLKSLNEWIVRNTPNTKQ